MATTIASFGNLPDRPLGMNTQRNIDRTKRHGVLHVAVLHPNDEGIHFYRSADDGATWTEATFRHISNVDIRAGVDMEVVSRPDGEERLIVTYVKGGRVRVSFGILQPSRQVFNWHTENKIADRFGTAGFRYPVLRTVPVPPNWYVWIFYGLRENNRALTRGNYVRFKGSDSFVSGDMQVMRRLSSVFPRPQVEVKHTGDDESIDLAERTLYVASNSGLTGDIFSGSTIEPRTIQSRIGYAGGSGWRHDRNRTVDNSGLADGTQFRGLSTSIFNGKAFITASVPDTDETRINLHLMNPSDTSRESIQTPQLGQGNIVALSATWDSTTGAVYIVAAGETGRRPHYIVYDYNSGTFNNWQEINTDPVQDGSISVKRGSRGSRIEMVYSTESGGLSVLKYELIALTNIPPSQPTWNTESGPYNKDAALVLNWNHIDEDDDPQSQYTLRRDDPDNGFEFWNGSAWQGAEINISSSTSQISLPSGSQNTGERREYQVRTSDGQAFSSYSAPLRLLGSVPVDPTLDSPTDPETIEEASLTAEWTVAEQLSFQIRVLDSTSTSELFSSGFIPEPSTREYSIPFDFQNGTTYVIELTTKNNEDLSSAAQTATVTFNFDPPSTPIITVTELAASRAFQIEITNPEPGTILNSNTSFETDLSGWQGTSGGITRERSSDFALDGDFSYKIIPDGSTSTVTGTTTFSSSPSGTSGNEYLVSAWSFLEDGYDQVSVVVQFRDASQVLLESTESIIKESPAGVWTYHEISAIAPANTDKVLIVVQMKDTPDASDIIYWDLAQIVEVTQPNTEINHIFRQRDGEDNFIRIDSTIPKNGSYIDYAVIHDKLHDYFVRAISPDGATADSLASG